MAGKKTEKKQAALTSFFTPKTVNGLAVPSSSADDETPRKRPLEEDAGGGNESPDRSAKRVRGGEARGGEAKGNDKGDSKSAGNAKTDKSGGKSSFFPSSSSASKQFEPASRPSASQASGSAPKSRAGRYAYEAPAGEDDKGEDDAEEDEQDDDRKQELHRKFVRKLGHADSLARGRAPAEPEDSEGEDEEEAPAKSRKKGAKTGKLTPMEVQFLEIKRKHLDTVLIVEVGYKFRFFGEDARIAAKELSIVCIPGKFRYDEHPSESHLDRFASASIPVHRLSVHAKRLVAAGHKVGVVRQIETAALKKAGDNRNAPFTRKLTNVYTKGTYIDEPGEQPASGGYLLCIAESPAKGAGTDEKVDVGIVAVQPATGDIVYDSFEDGFMRREMETRLLHIAPCEFVIVGEQTRASDKMVRHLSGSRTNVFGDRSRVERVPRSKTAGAEAYSHVTQFYADKTRAGTLLDKVLQLPELVTVCLSAMITHLTEYGLEHVFDLTKYFESFSTRQHMLVTGTTLESLEVYRNATDHAERGSLFWALDKTQTRSGQRLLRKWIGRPLLDHARLQERVAAVEELLHGSPKVEKLRGLLASVKTDLERSLIRIYYGKCTRPELLATLQTLQRIATAFSDVRTPADAGFESSLLCDAVCALPAMRDVVVSHLDKINAEAARRDDKYSFFRDDDAAADAITDHKLGIAAVEQELDAQRAEAAAKLGKKSPISYATVAGIEYLVEVANADLKRVPASWVKISGTKRVSRFHPPEVVALMAQRDQHKEALAAACDAAFAALLRSLAAEYQPLRDAVAALATLDCLLSLARVAALPGYAKPTLLPPDAPPSVSVTAGRHPMAEHLLPGGYIPFTTSLAAPAPLAQLITGPNMGGKSSYVRAVALLVLLAQIGSFVPAAAMELTLADAVHTRMGARDNLFAGESTFMVEVSETAAILRAATPRSLVVLDELGRGTSTHDGAAIAHAVLSHVAREARCLTLFITHYQDLARVAHALGPGLVRCVHMRFAEAEGADGEQDITFLYEVGEGVAHRSYGLNVARLARIPRRVLDVAGQKSAELEAEIRARRVKGAARLMGQVVGGGVDQLDQLVSSIEQL